MTEPVDLTDQLTIFILTVGAQTFPRCMQHVKAQAGCEFRIEVIQNIAPMSSALQAMLDRCETPFFIQVDEDMLLYSSAALTLYQHIAGSPPDVAQVTYQLWDSHAERVIHGIKIYRHEIVRNFPYRNIQSCEFDQVQRYRKDGFSENRIHVQESNVPGDAVLGVHKCDFSYRTLFERYLTLEQKFRRHTVSEPVTSGTWVEEQAEIFLKRFLETNSQSDLYALMGVIAGRLGAIDDQPEEKDFRTYENLPGFDSLLEFVHQAAERTNDSKG